MLNNVKSFFQYRYIGQSILFFILIFYTIYAVLSSSTSEAEFLLPFFAMISGVYKYISDPKNFFIYIKNIMLFLIGYFILGYISLNFSQYADTSYFFEKFPYIVFALLIPVGFYKIPLFQIDFFRKGLTVLLYITAFVIILMNFGFLEIDGKTFFGIVLHHSHWVEKDYLFWYIFLMFATVAFYDIYTTSGRMNIFFILIISYFVIFFGYSFLARIDYLIGIVILLIFSLFKIPKRYLYFFLFAYILYIMLAPMILSFIDLSGIHHRLDSRNLLNHVSSEIVKKSYWHGYGFGSTLTIPLGDYFNIENYPYLNHHHGVFPGGHPHNVVMLFWLEFGVVGAIFLSYFLFHFIKYLIEETEGRNFIRGVVIAMVIAINIIASFSWSIWYPQVLLTFSFVGVAILLVLNISDNQFKESIYHNKNIL